MTWRRARTEIVDDLVRWLDNEIADPGALPERGFEVAFGGRWSGKEESPLLHRRAAPAHGRGPRCPAPRPDRPARVGAGGGVPDHRLQVRPQPGQGRLRRRARRSSSRSTCSPRPDIVEIDVSTRQRLLRVRDAARRVQPRTRSRASTSPRNATTSTACSTGSSAASRAATSTPEPGESACRICDFDASATCAATRSRRARASDERRVSFAEMKDDPVSFVPTDQPARDRIRDALDESLCVEAGAGTGKTTALVSPRRECPANGARDRRPDRGHHVHRGRRGRALEPRTRRARARARRASSTPTARDNLHRALTGLYRAHIETIHAFCGNAPARAACRGRPRPRIRRRRRPRRPARLRSRVRRFPGTPVSMDPCPRSELRLSRGFGVDEIRALVEVIDRNPRAPSPPARPRDRRRRRRLRRAVPTARR